MYDFKEKINNKAQLNDFIRRHVHSSKYTIHEDLTVDIDGAIDLSNLQLTMIPCQFGIVNGSFSCANNQLTSLFGAPHKISGHFFCQKNKLTSLEYCPSVIPGNFDCSFNQLSSLKNGPKELIEEGSYLIFGDYSCSNNPITELSDLPEKLNNFYCKNTLITSLKNSPHLVENYHAESNLQLKELNLENVTITDTLYLDENPNLMSLKNGPKHIGLGLILPNIPVKNILDITFPFSFMQQNINHAKDKIKELENFYKKINKTELSYYFRLELNMSEFEMLKLNHKLNNEITCHKESKRQKI
jgi:hypothetical protein